MSIHIKPENKGKFNATKARTGKSTEELTHSKNPVTRKRAIFAQNASKWKHADGGLVGPAALGDMAGNAIFSAIPDKSVKDANGNIIGSYESTGEALGKGALDGALAGAAFGPIGMGVGALVGAGSGLINRNREKKQLLKTQGEMNNNIKTGVRLGRSLNVNNTINTAETSMYPHGGVVNNDQPGANAELELQEQMQLPDGTVMGVDGPSHDEGGVEVNVPAGTRVFSDRLTLGKKTFAQHAKSINNKIAKLEGKPDNMAKKNTEMLFNKQLDNLFNTQESMKTEKYKRTFAKGGMIPATNVKIMEDGGYFTPENFALASQLGGNFLQNQEFNKVPRPRTIQHVTFTPGDRPDLVNYSAERAVIDAEAAAAKRGVTLGSRSYSTQAANLQKITNDKIAAKGRSLQTQNNANIQLNNAYKNQQATAYNQGVQANLGIDQYNTENQMNYNLWRAGNKARSIAAATDSFTNIFNNKQHQQDQIEQWNVLKNMYDPSVANDIAKGSRFAGSNKKAYGAGRSIVKGYLGK